MNPKRIFKSKRCVTDCRKRPPTSASAPSTPSICPTCHQRLSLLQPIDLPSDGSYSAEANAEERRNLLIHDLCQTDVRLD